MAQGDLKVRTPMDPAFSIRRIVASGAAASINGGEPTKEGSSGAVAIMADGDGTTSQNFSGLAKTVSTDTASVAGEVYVWIPLPGLMYDGAAKSATAADTLAEIDALMFKRVVFDLTGTSWTIDTAASNATTNGVIIVGGDFRKSRIYFTVGVNVTKWGNPTTA